MITLGAVCKKCGESITIDQEEYERDPEYAYWYGEDDAYCQMGNYDTPHAPGDTREVVEDDGFRKINLSTEARAVLAGLLAPEREVRSDGIHASDEAWEALRSALPVAQFWAWLETIGQRDESGLNAEGIGYNKAGE